MGNNNIYFATILFSEFFLLLVGKEFVKWAHIFHKAVSEYVVG